MPTVDLTARLARQSKPGPKETFLFDRTLPGFGLRIHPSGRKVWIVQARIEGRSCRIVIARHGEMELAEARRRARDTLALIRAGGNPADDIRREKQTPTKPAGPRPSPRSGCWRSPDAAGAKYSISVGGTSAKTRSIWPIRRPVRAPCRSARPRGR